MLHYTFTATSMVKVLDRYAPQKQSCSISISLQCRRNSSTSNLAPNTHLLEKYLVNSLGFSIEEAASTSSKVTSSRILKNPDSVLTLLKQTGLDTAQIKDMVSKAPKLLFSDVSKTLIPKFQCLMDLGFLPSDLVNVFVKDANRFARSLDNHIKPTIDLLRRITGSDEAVVKVVKRFPWVLSLSCRHTMETNLMVLRNSGVSDMHIQKLVVKDPRCIMRSTEWVKDILHRAVNDFRLPVDSPMFPYGFIALSSQTKTMLEKKIGVFKSFGWSDEEVLKMFRKSPYCVAHSEDRIRKSLNFYMKELGYKPAYLASHPSILIYSLERRVVPRMQVLKILDEKNLKRRKFGLYSVLCLSELKFIECFVLPYKDQIPDLYESHKDRPWKGAIPAQCEATRRSKNVKALIGGNSVGLHLKKTA